MKRRKFIEQALLLAGSSSLLQQCNIAGHTFSGKIAGANSATGHLLKDPDILLSPSAETIQTGTLIIGGGVSGLSAARWLKKNGDNNFLLAELSEDVGGNAASGQNNISAYPWGAHYIPLPNNDLPEYLSFLESCNIITGYEKGLPVINEYYLCFEPQERLYINGYWQEGLIPHFGVPGNELQEIKRFLAAMEEFRKAKGEDGKYAFAIPAQNSSKDPRYTHLDTISMPEWLEKEQYHSSHLHWYINYCCRDDFGTDYRLTSAWAGIHYFAGRKGTAANAPAQSVITWPEGNGWLVQQIKNEISSAIQTNTLVLQVHETAEGVEAIMLDTITKKIKTVKALQCIMAIPQFAACRLLSSMTERQKIVQDNFVYFPWMVANITTTRLQERSGAALSWDNVIFRGNGLGYVEATHQQLQQRRLQNVLTYYLPLTETTAAEERKKAQQRSFEEWVHIIQADLNNIYPDFSAQVNNIDIWIWGHGMISPQKNFIHGDVRYGLQQPVNNKIFFAHTDLAGISIFEEAFYQGINAAKAILNK